MTQSVSPAPLVAGAFSSYLIVGDGNVARHFAHYFTLAGIPFRQWSRRSLNSAASRDVIELPTAEHSHVLLLISDGAIEHFYKQHMKSLSGKTVVHFSGSLASRLLPGAHPLMTFSTTLYDLKTYKQIPFVVERLAYQTPNSMLQNPEHLANENLKQARRLLPGLSNPIYVIDREQKPLYHALCAMSGNFTVMLWEHVFKSFAERLKLPKESLLPYLRQVSRNLSESPPQTSVLTGPVARGDWQVIDKHLHSLQDDAYQSVYQAFVRAHSQESVEGKPAPNSENHFRKGST